MIPPEMDGWPYLELPFISVNGNITFDQGNFRPVAEYVMDNVSQAPINDDRLYRDPEYPRVDLSARTVSRHVLSAIIGAAHHILWPLIH
jgi:hypothetical protein